MVVLVVQVDGPEILYVESSRNSTILDISLVFKPGKLLLVGGFKIQLVVNMYFPWVLHFDNILF